MSWLAVSLSPGGVAPAHAWGPFDTQAMAASYALWRGLPEGDWAAIELTELSTSDRFAASRHASLQAYERYKNIPRD